VPFREDHRLPDLAGDQFLLEIFLFGVEFEQNFLIGREDGQHVMIQCFRHAPRATFRVGIFNPPGGRARNAARSNHLDHSGLGWHEQSH
jgi:hypothetical protein